MVAAALEGLARQIPVQIVRVREIGILRELIPCIELARVGRAIPDRIIRERLIEGQRVGGGRQPVEPIIAEILHTALIGEARAIPDRVVHIISLIDLRAGGENLVQDVLHLARRVGVRQTRARSECPLFSFWFFQHL